MALFIYACGNPERGSTSVPVAFDTIQYSKSFGIAHFDSYKQLFYVEGADTIWSLTSKQLNNTPKIAVLSSVFAGFIEELGRTQSIIAVDKFDYYSDSTLLKRMKDGHITVIGEEGQINVEKVLKIKPDILISSSMSRNDKALTERLSRAGIQCLYCDNFKEQHPLARAEWIKFFGFLTGTSNQADSIFKVIESNYLNIAKSNQSIAYRPRVLTDAMYQDAWNIPGGESYSSRLIRDAGGIYVFNDMDDFYTYPLNLETVLKKGADADVWIHVNQFHNRDEMLKSEPRYRLFKAFKAQMVFNYNKRENPLGGNDFWECGAARPDIILKDLSIIFRMDKNNFPNLYFYTRLD